jgi:hypothetical protein
MAYQIYKQDNEYNIANIYEGKFISPDIIEKYIDLSKLTNKNLFCYGVGNGNNFIELSYDNQEYCLRISKDNDEYFEDISEDIITDFYNKIADILN